jgi:hypothetical protein
VPVLAVAPPWNTPLREAGQVAKAPPSNTWAHNLLKVQRSMTPDTGYMSWEAFTHKWPTCIYNQMHINFLWQTPGIRKDPLSWRGCDFHSYLPGIRLFLLFLLFGLWCLCQLERRLGTPPYAKQAR